MAARVQPNKPRLTPIPRNYGLFCGLFRASYALRQGGNQIGDSTDGFGRGAVLGIEAAAERIDQRGAYHGAIGILRDRACRIRRADAEANANREPGMTLDAGNGLAD